MLLTTLSAGAIIYSTLLTKLAVTGRYQVHPCVSKKNIRTQPSSWMEMALEDGGSMAALGSCVGHRLKIAVVVLGDGGSTRTCNDGISIDVGVKVIKAKGLLLQHWHQCQ
jgi:hypothetical protein